MVKISFLVEDGALFSGSSGLIDMFSIANLWHRDLYKNNKEDFFQTEIVSFKKKTLNLSGNVSILGIKEIKEIDNTQIIIVPPFLPNSELIPDKAMEIYSFLNLMYNKGVLIASMCTGSFVLAEAGLLKGKRATTNWMYASLFKKRYPDVRLQADLILAEERNLITTGAASSFYNLGLYIIEKFCTAKLAGICSKALLIDSASKSQASYAIFIAHKDHGDEMILKAQNIMEQNYSKTLTIENLEKNFMISSRQFKRRFKAATGYNPIGYLQHLRINAAKNMLEEKSKNIEEISYRIGYENSSNFRKVFKKYTGISPREYREKFSRIF